MIEYGQFLSHSKYYLPWKIECDDLSDNDINSLARIISNNIEFGKVYGIPRGGIRLAKACEAWIISNSSRTLIVDDVFTTGKSMLEAQKLLGNNIVGVVIFDRGLCELPHWINSIFTVSKWSQGEV